MDNLPKVKFINLMFVLSPEHACILERSVEAAKETTNKEVNDAIGLNRTMHEYARTMHVMSSSDNLAAISKAFGRYTRLELDENQSKLHEDLQTSVDGWKQLAIVYNDQNVTYLCLLSISFTIFIVFVYHFRAKILFCHLLILSYVLYIKVEYMHACEEDICDPEVCTLPRNTFPY